MRLEDIVSKKENLEESIVKMIADFEKETGMWAHGIGLGIEYSSGSMGGQSVKGARIISVSIIVDNKMDRVE